MVQGIDPSELLKPLEKLCARVLEDVERLLADDPAHKRGRRWRQILVALLARVQAERAACAVGAPQELRGEHSKPTPLVIQIKLAEREVRVSKLFSRIFESVAEYLLFASNWTIASESPENRERHAKLLREKLDASWEEPRQNESPGAGAARMARNTALCSRVLRKYWGDCDRRSPPPPDQKLFDESVFGTLRRAERRFVAVARGRDAHAWVVRRPRSTRLTRRRERRARALRHGPPPPDGDPDPEPPPFARPAPRRAESFRSRIGSARVPSGVVPFVRLARVVPSYRARPPSFEPRPREPSRVSTGAGAVPAGLLPLTHSLAVGVDARLKRRRPRARGRSQI